jgi:hypothetical protein
MNRKKSDQNTKFVTKTRNFAGSCRSFGIPRRKQCQWRSFAKFVEVINRWTSAFNLLADMAVSVNLGSIADWAIPTCCSAQKSTAVPPDAPGANRFVSSHIL